MARKSPSRCGAPIYGGAAARPQPGNALIAAWSGVLVAGLAMPGGDPRRAYGENGLKRALEQSVFEDGGSVTRSPVAQIESIQFLTLVGEAYAARRLEVPAF